MYTKKNIVLLFCIFTLFSCTEKKQNAIGLENRQIESNERQSSYDSSSSSYSSGTSTSYSSKKCSWCGKSFKGDHYTHMGKLASCERITNKVRSIGTFCSLKCCREDRKSSCPTC